MVKCKLRTYLIELRWVNKGREVKRTIVQRGLTAKKAKDKVLKEYQATADMKRRRNMQLIRVTKTK